MILTDNQIIDFITHPKNVNLKDYMDEHDKLDTFYNGGDIASQIEKITGFENQSQKTLREKFARSPKDLIERLTTQFNKVFSAKGGSQTIDIKIEANKNNFIELISLLPEGISLNKWMQDYWFEGYITDPNGIIFIESELESEGIPNAYPTYKSVNVIHDYTLTWSKLNYLILKHGKFTIGKKQVDVYRVIDDGKDALYYLENKSLKEFVEIEGDISIINHNKGFVPAILLSDIIDKKTGGKKSFLNKIDDLLDEYVRESSVLSIFKFLHAYPKYWQYVSKCVKCFGTTKIPDPNDATKKITCTSCNGSGLHIKQDISDGISIPVPKKDDPVLAPNLAGFVAPPIEAWGKMEESLDLLEKKMQIAVLGTYTEEEKSNTATGRFIDTQPLDTSLHKVSETEETIKTKVATYMAKWMYGDDFGKVKILNGKRFICEHPDTIWDKYTKARESKAPTSTLDYLYKQYLLSEYQNDQAMFEQKLKEFQIEPLVHFTLEDLNGLDIDVSQNIESKLLFSDWLNTSPDFTNELENLRKDFDGYINENKIK